MVTGQNVKNLLLFTRGASMESLFGALAFAMFIAAHALAIAVVEPEGEDWPAFVPRPGRPGISLTAAGLEVCQAAGPD